MTVHVLQPNPSTQQNLEIHNHFDINSPDSWKFVICTYMSLTKIDMRFLSYDDPKDSNEINQIEGNDGRGGILSRVTTAKMGKLSFLAKKINFGVVQIKPRQAIDQGGSNIILLVRLDEASIAFMKTSNVKFYNFLEEDSKDILTFDDGDKVRGWEMQCVKKSRILWNLSKSHNIIGGIFRFDKQIDSS